MTEGLSQPYFISMKNFFIKAMATGLGVGYGPVDPGTYGTIVGIPFFILLYGLGPMGFAIATLIFTIFACVISDYAGKLFGETDCQKIVIDEVAGFLFTMAWLPATWKFIVVGFVVFRILDSTKPWPIRWFEENIPGGTGVVADDVAAGIVGCALIHAFIHFFPQALA
jgi:phosphatidylglycerophosphatase A